MTARRARAVLPLALVAAVLASSLSGCGEAPPPAAPKKATTLWRHLQTWRGQASLQTESFGDSGAYRIHWTAKNVKPDVPGRLKITLHSAISGRPLVEVIEHQGDGEDTEEVTEDPREFFLVVEAEGTSWTIDLEEGVTAYLSPAQGSRP